MTHIIQKQYTNSYICIYIYVYIYIETYKCSLLSVYNACPIEPIENLIISIFGIIKEAACVQFERIFAIKHLKRMLLQNNAMSTRLFFAMMRDALKNILYQLDFTFSFSFSMSFFHYQTLSFHMLNITKAKVKFFFFNSIA